MIDYKKKSIPAFFLLSMLIGIVLVNFFYVVFDFGYSQTEVFIQLAYICGHFFLTVITYLLVFKDKKGSSSFLRFTLSLIVFLIVVIVLSLLVSFPIRIFIYLILFYLGLSFCAIVISIYITFKVFSYVDFKLNSCIIFCLIFILLGISLFALVLYINLLGFYLAFVL
ncbi:MAG: hypothetical protein KatS3mg078_0772 [Deltaproteobacteria bacterium]|jgi:hypothetical protein|nr:MAG: hypothetical protein KatS3mg078_0772 [Deltaproteobacteria bacterium]